MVVLMAQSHTIEIDTGDTVSNSTIVLGSLHDDRALTLKVGNREFFAGGSDYFDAFCEIRKTMEDEGLQAMCYGACRNVWPSSMARDAGGLNACLMRDDRPPTRDDLVFIFDSGDDMELSTVRDQEKYARAWFRSAPKRSHLAAKKSWWKFWK
jgi:hypothetical protein